MVFMRMQTHAIQYQLKNRNNRFISDGKSFRNQEIFLSSIFVGIDTLDPDRSYLVNFKFFCIL